MARWQIPGSERTSHVQGHVAVARVHPDSRVQATVVAKTTHAKRRLAIWLESLGASVCHTGPRTFKVQAPAHVAEKAFGVELHDMHGPAGSRYRGQLGPVSVPQEFAHEVTAVLGLDSRPHCRRPDAAQLRPVVGRGPCGRAAGSYQPLLPAQLAKAYGWPAGDGSGQTIGIVSLGGSISIPELEEYFAQTGITRTGTIDTLSVDGNQAVSDPDGADVENNLDVCVAGALAPGANIIVGEAANTDNEFLDCYLALFAAGCTEVTCSWGGPEESWTGQAISAFTQELGAAKAKGVILTGAAGDSGSSDGAPGENVDYPASDPSVVGMGGTVTLLAPDGSLASQGVWGGVRGDGATGGGYSSVFPRPAYQANVAGAQRGVPDAAANADPRSGWIILGGSVGGTSAAAPCMAAWFACARSAGASIPDAHAFLYANAAAFSDVTVGSNGAYVAAVGWDPCTGNGTPSAKLAAAAAATASSSGGSGGATAQPTSGNGGTATAPAQPPTLTLAPIEQWRLTILLEQLQSQGVPVNMPAQAGQAIGIG